MPSLNIYSEVQNKPTICSFFKQTEVILRRQNIPLNCHQPLELLMYIGKGFRSFNAENLGSVGQRASKLPAFKVGGHKKKSAHRPRPHSYQSASVRTRAKSNHSQSLMAGNFAALWPADPKFSAKKDLFFFSLCIEFQCAGSILKVGFVLSKWYQFWRV